MNQSIDNFLFVDMSKTGENNHLEISCHPPSSPDCYRDYRNEIKH